MSVPLDRDQARRIVGLARLDPPPEEEEGLIEHLRRILGYFSKLEELDTEGVPSSASVLSPTPRWRDDDPGESLPGGEAMRGAPDREGDHFRVPRVID